MTDKDTKLDSSVAVEEARSDKEVFGEVDPEHRDENDTTGTVRGLKARHLQLIGTYFAGISSLRIVLTSAIGATVGTGLFIGSSRGLIYAGPAGALVGFALYCTVIWGK